MGASGPSGAIAVRGLRDLTRDFQKLSDLGQDVSWELEEVADVVAQEAEQLLISDLAGIPGRLDGTYFATTRVAVSKREGIVYVVPAWRTRGKRRTDKQREQVSTTWQKRFEKALEMHEPEVVEKLEHLIDRLGGEYDFY